MSRLTLFLVLITVAFVLAAPAAKADVNILVRTDGSAMDGKIISQNDKQVLFRPDGAKAAQAVPRDSVARILTTDDHGALLKTSGTISGPGAGQVAGAAPKWDVPALPAAPAVRPKKAGESSYCLVPLHGVVGSTVLATALEKSLEDAVARRPNVIVLDIDSPGGSVEEAKKIIGVLRRYNKKARIVALCGQDLSAAAIFTLSVREIYAKPDATIGAATSFRIGPEGTPADVEEKFQSAWRAVGRGSAEEGKHEPLLAEAMIDSSTELHLEKARSGGDKYVVREGPGEISLCRKGKILTLTSHEAVQCGLAAGIVEDLAELGEALHRKGWKQTPALGPLLADALPKRAAAYEAEGEKIHARLTQHLRAAVAADPSEQVVTVTRVGPAFGPTQIGPPRIGRRYVPGRHGPIFVPVPTVPAPPMRQTITQIRTKSPDRWKPDSMACVLALQDVEADLRDAVSLGAAFDRPTDVEGIREAAAKIASIRATVFDNRDKFGAGNETKVAVVEQKRPPALSPARPRELPGAGITQPARITIDNLPDDRAPTDQIGGRGGGPFVTMKSERTPVIGFRYAMGDWGGRECLRGFRPLYDKPADAPPAHFKDLLARDGYVVSGINGANDRTNVVAVQVIFVRDRDGKADPKDHYESDWIGNTANASPVHTLGGDGQVVVGVYGHQGLNLDALGLIVAAKAPEPAATTK